MCLLGPLPQPLLLGTSVAMLVHGFGRSPTFTEARRALARWKERFFLLRLAWLSVIACLPNKYTGKWKSTDHLESKVTGYVQYSSRTLICVLCSGSGGAGRVQQITWLLHPHLQPHKRLQEMRLNEKIRSPRSTAHPIWHQRPELAPCFRPNKAVNWPPHAASPWLIHLRVSLPSSLHPLLSVTPSCWSGRWKTPGDHSNCHWLHTNHFYSNIMKLMLQPTPQNRKWQ